MSDDDNVNVVREEMDLEVILYLLEILNIRPRILASEYEHIFPPRMAVKVACQLHIERISD